MKEHRTTPVLEPVELPGTTSSDVPRPLPYIAYPKARDVTRHGVQQLARVVAASFARREPQSRHISPPKHPPAGLMETRHTDPFGSGTFGSWSRFSSC